MRFFLCFLMFSVGISGGVFASGFQSLVEFLRLRGHAVTFDWSEFKPNVRLQADRFIFDIDDGSVVGNDHVLMTYDQILLNSDKMHYGIQEKIVTVYEDVLVQRDLMKLRCDSARFLLPHSIQAKGSVLFDFKSYHSTSGKAHYDLRSNILELQDNVVLKERGDVIAGNVVKFDIENEKVISQGRSRVKLSTKRLKSE